MANYYHQFIKSFASIARPLHDIVKKNKKWEWIEKQERAFGELKIKFTEELVLVAPDLDKKIWMEVDASDYVTGGVLLMECEDKLCVVATTYHKGQMISLTSKPQSRSIVWEFTRELDKEPLLN